jgi:uncharacterized protein (TIGR03435 family)
MRAWILGIVTVSCAAMAQRPAFEVASVKLSEPVPIGQNYNINLGRIQHGELTLTNTTLSDCIRFAYRLVSDDQMAGPDWVKSKEFRYDIVAKTGPETSPEQIQEMLQTLLAERFKLETHSEPRVLAHYELVIAKGGLKMHEAKPDAPESFQYLIGHLSSTRTPMERFLMLLSRQLRQAVLDRTGLTGQYALDLKWTPDSAAGDAATESGPSIFSAIQDQLGLKLEPHKSLVPILVIDHADKVPVAN